MKSALRNLLRDRKFTVFSILVLGLGIAANTTAFTLIRSVLLHELPFRDPDKLVWIWSTRTDRDKAFFSIANFIDTRDSASTLSEVAALALWPVNLTGSGDAERVQGVRLSANAFAMLGVRAAAGRLIEPTDGKPGNDLVVVLSHGLWRRRFGGSTGAIGGNVILNGVAYRLIGVLPREFALPNTETDIISPFVFETDPRNTQRGANFLRAFARVKDGASVEQVRLQLAAITDRLRTQYPDDNGKHTPPRVRLLGDEIVGSYRASLWTLFAAIGIVLAVACANLANLVSARASGRRIEMAVRAALGAGRLAPARSFFLESLALTIVGAAIGCTLSWWMIQGITQLLPTGFPRIEAIAIDWTVFGFAALLTLIVAIGLALAPALAALRIDIHETLKGTARFTGKSSGSKTRRSLVIAEVALSFVLMIAAGLLVRSFLRLQAVDSGIKPRNVLVTRMSLPMAQYSTTLRTAQFVSTLLDAIRRSSGVGDAAVASALPLSGVNSRTEFFVTGYPPTNVADTPAAQTRWISEDYFDVMGIPIDRGKAFTAFDRGSDLVGIVDEALVRRYMRNMNPLEQSLAIDFGDEPIRIVRVVGVVGNVKHFGLDDPPTPTIYFPLAGMAGRAEYGEFRNDRRSEDDSTRPASRRQAAPNDFSNRWRRCQFTGIEYGCGHCRRCRSSEIQCFPYGRFGGCRFDPHDLRALCRVELFRYAKAIRDCRARGSRRAREASLLWSWARDSC
jgi:predicted permease